MAPLALRGWLFMPVLALLSLLCSFVSAASHSFENTAIVRTVDLGGSLVHVTTTYAIRALDNGAQQYFVTLGEKEARSASWFEAKLKGQNEPLTVTTDLLGPHESAPTLSCHRLMLTRLFYHLQRHLLVHSQPAKAFGC